MNKFLLKMKIGTLAMSLPLLVSLASDAQAWTKKSIPIAPVEPATTPMTPAEFQAAMKDAKARSKRSVAAQDRIDDHALSVSFRNLRNELIGHAPRLDANGNEIGVFTGLTVPDLNAPDFQTKLKAFHAYFAKLNDDNFYNTLAPDAKFAAAQMAPLVTFRGFFNRAQKLFGSANLTHSAAVTGLRMLASGVISYFPTDQWTAGLRYVTYPTTEWKVLIDKAPGVAEDHLIDNEYALHAFIEREVEPALRKMEFRLKSLDFSQNPIYFDNKIFYGTASFVSDQDEYVRLGEAERRAALAGVYFTLSGISSLDAYSMNGLFNATDEIGRLYGIGSIFKAEGSTASQRYFILKRYNDQRCTNDPNCGLFRLRGGSAKQWMANAYGWLVNAVQASRISWAELGCLSGEDPNCQKPAHSYTSAQRADATRHMTGDRITQGNLFDPSVWIIGNRIAQSSLEGMEYIVNGGNGSLQSAVVSGDGTTINLKPFFEPNPPENLADFFPTHFNQEKYQTPTSIKVDGQVMNYHNYLQGSPDAWATDKFTPYFGPVSDVRKLARDTAQSWGGWLVGVPLGALMF